MIFLTAMMKQKKVCLITLMQRGNIRGFVELSIEYTPIMANMQFIEGGHILISRVTGIIFWRKDSLNLNLSVPEVTRANTKLTVYRTERKKRMTFEERVKVDKIIDKMVGSREQQREITSNMTLENRIRSNNEYQKMREKLMKIAEKEGIENLNLVIITCGRSGNGVTKSGKKFVWEGNNGVTERSRYCGSLYVEDVGTVFTSGTIAKVVEYIINN